MEDLRETFEQIKRSDAWQRSRAPERLAKLPGYGFVQSILVPIFLVAFIGIGVAISTVSMSMGGALGMVPLLFPAVGAVMLLVVLVKQARFRLARVEALPAVVVGKRTKVWGGGQDMSASTSYYLTVEHEDGSRVELDARSALYAMVAERDAGVLFRRAGVALDFDQIDPERVA